MNTNLKDKVIIITGASSGIGAEVARHLAQAGCKLVLAARRLDRLESLAKELNQNSEQAVIVAMDVRKKAEVQNVADTALQKFGRIDAIINNAGIMPQAPMKSLPIDEWDNMIDVNIKGVLYGIAAVLPTMQKQQSGHIINLSSVAGLRVASGMGTVYSATKFAVKALSEGLRVEVANDNIKVTTLYPGAIKSELVDSIINPEARNAVRGFYDNFEITPDSIARAVVFALEQPDDVAINEITIRPTKQDF